MTTDKFPHQLLIDTSFDEEFANQLARYETFNKHHYRPNTYLHKWWGRRCGSTFRLILKGLIENPQQQDYYSPGGLEGKVILDPMMGGGTTIHEAIRLGANVIGIDVDPIPVLQARATLQETPLEQLDEAFAAVSHAITQSVGELFNTNCPVCDSETPLQYTLHGLKKQCNCREVVVVDSLSLRQQPDGSRLGLCPACGEIMINDVHDCRAAAVAVLIDKKEDSCPDCGAEYREDISVAYFSRYYPLVVAGYCPHDGLFFKSPDERDRHRLECANQHRAGVKLPVDQFQISPGDKSIRLWRRGIYNYLDLFSSRQLLVYARVIEHLAGLSPDVRLVIALLFSTSLEFNSLLCGYKGTNKRRAGAVRHTFSHHSYAFPHTALENNPIYPQRASGTLQQLYFSRVRRGRLWANAPRERDLSVAVSPYITIHGERDHGLEVASTRFLESGSQQFYLMQGSATSIPIEDGIVDAVVTDPPYYDSVQYGDLSAFFRVWLQQMLPQQANWLYDRATAAVSPERNLDSQQYVRLMTGIFHECRRVLRPDSGRLIFTFHHWRPEAWSALAIPLYLAGFVLINRYIVHAEHPISVHIRNLRALTHDAILVFGQRDSVVAPDWKKPDDINAPATSPIDSFQFTHSCATFLGWLLNQPDLQPEGIKASWTSFLVKSG